MTNYVVYDSEGEVDGIKTYAHKMMAVLKQYTTDVKFSPLSSWNASENNRNNVVYITSIENEDFHTKVKQLFLKGLSNCMVVLQYSPADENHVNKFKTSVKNSLKKLEPNKLARKQITKETLDRIETVKFVKNVSQWWPKVLKFLIQAPVNRNSNLAREIGVFFKIDWDNDAQVEWLESQRNTLENVFKVQCRHNDSLMAEDTYIKYSTCVVMYVDRSLYQDLRSRSARKDGKKRMLESIKETRDACNRHGTKFQVFIDQAGVKLTNVLATDYSLKIVGNGMMFHWMGLLSMLNLIRVGKKPDMMFYSKKDREEQELNKFRPDFYPHLFRIVHSPREGIQRLASPSSVLADTLQKAGSVKEVSYQSMDAVVIDSDDSTVRPLWLCCTQFMALRAAV
ncbi:uncharacterized protein LOC123546975 [Mercenaria mercenaria]|uniref:uncharacterized protein LOC123546975 n=1 Tax=Mercenaria mercenaria TaxID=6596 RepID=UPI00234F0EB4|nr:uncharacterized protein LOC123546975 [Mercenaria mercenaria]